MGTGNYVCMLGKRNTVKILIDFRENWLKGNIHWERDTSGRALFCLSAFSKYKGQNVLKWPALHRVSLRKGFEVTVFQINGNSVGASRSQSCVYWLKFCVDVQPPGEYQGLGRSSALLHPLVSKEFPGCWVLVVLLVFNPGPPTKGDNSSSTKLAVVPKWVYLIRYKWAKIHHCRLHFQIWNLWLPQLEVRKSCPAKMLMTGGVLQILSWWTLNVCAILSLKARGEKIYTTKYDFMNVP